MVRYTLGYIWLRTDSMPFHKSQPDLSRTARKERKGLIPCAAATKPMEKKEGSRRLQHIDLKINPYVCVCTQAYPGAYVRPHRQTSIPPASKVPVDIRVIRVDTYSRSCRHLRAALPLTQRAASELWTSRASLPRALRERRAAEVALLPSG